MGDNGARPGTRRRRPGVEVVDAPTDVEPTFYDSGFPILYPGTIQEVVDLGLHGFELSRYSGFWVGFKILTTIADGLSTIEVGPHRFRAGDPDLEIDGQPWRHVQRPGVLAPISLDQEKDMAYGRVEAATAYAAANGLNRIDVHTSQVARAGGRGDHLLRIARRSPISASTTRRCAMRAFV